MPTMTEAYLKKASELEAFIETTNAVEFFGMPHGTAIITKVQRNARTNKIVLAVEEKKSGWDKLWDGTRWRKTIPTFIPVAEWPDWIEEDHRIEVLVETFPIKQFKQFKPCGESPKAGSIAMAESLRGMLIWDE